MASNDGYRPEILDKYRPSTPPAARKRKNGRPSPKKSSKPTGCARWLILLIQLTLVGILGAILLFVGAYVYFSNQLSDSIAEVVNYSGSGLGGTPRFYDRNGTLLFELTTTEKRRALAYGEIPPTVINATVAVEDDTFWTNYGFDPYAIGAAVVSNYRNENGRPVGASTITQQLVRHIAFTYEERVGVSYQRKLREIFLAFIITQQRSKQDIIQLYLNEIYYGNLAYGIEAAAQTYFAKSTQDLQLHEIAFLVGLPQSPIQLDPYTNFDAAKARQELILELMVEDGMIDGGDAEVAKGVTVQLAPLISLEEEASEVTLEAAHFVLYVQRELERRYGPDALVRGGWQVTTSLDLSLHSFAEQAAREWVFSRAANHNVSNASVVVLKPGTGEILSMVGSLDYFNEAIDGQVNIALSPRQPGSSIKPITYAAAMEQGWTAGDVLWDVPIVLDLGGGELMRPVNYDRAYHGPVLFRDALANSYNIPPIQLIRDIGIQNFIQTARKMGIESLDQPPGFYGLALTLGGGEVPLLEMAHAYGTLANLGQRPHLTSVLRITDSRGNVLFDLQENRIPPANVLDPRIAFVMSDILDDDDARVPAMGRGNALELPFPTAVKTGTTNDFRDNWTVGYTPGVVVGVWVGNANGVPMRDSSGLRGAAPLWNQIMRQIYADPLLTASLMVDGALPPAQFAQPAGLELKNVCLPRGTGGGSCTASRQDYFVVSAPAHGHPRIGYAPDLFSNPGAWTVRTAALPTEAAERVTLPDLDDGTQAPRPTSCVINSAGSQAGSERLLLPVPSHYPDEIRARIWARGRGFQMAPSTVCPVDVVREANERASGGGGNNESGSEAPRPTATRIETNFSISSPTPGAALSGLVVIEGTAVFDPTVISHYQLEIGAGTNPTEWQLFGTARPQQVISGGLEQLQTATLPAGDYSIRLVLFGRDGEIVERPFVVPITISR